MMNVIKADRDDAYEYDAKWRVTLSRRAYVNAMGVLERSYPRSYYIDRRKSPNPFAKPLADWYYYHGVILLKHDEQLTWLSLHMDEIMYNPMDDLF